MTFFVNFSELIYNYKIIFPITDTYNGTIIHDLDNLKSTLLNIKRKLYSCWRCSNNYVSSHFESWNPCTVIRIALKITRLCLHKKILLKWGESLRPWIDNNFPSVWSSPLRLLDTKGQLNSEWIYEVTVSSKMWPKNLKDFYPGSLLEGRAETLVIFGWNFGRNGDLINSFWI